MFFLDSYMKRKSVFLHFTQNESTITFFCTVQLMINCTVQNPSEPIKFQKLCKVDDYLQNGILSLDLKSF